MKKILSLMAVAMLAAGHAEAQEKGNELYGEIAPVTKTYLRNVYGNMGWDSNWFIGVQGGVSAFLGKPVGHGDFFDRTKGMIGVNVGKWITPTVGIRLAYQGWELKSAMMDNQKYQNFHADLMYNVSYFLQGNSHETVRWNFIPYVGLGAIHSNTTHNRPVALSYGIQVGYNLTKRLTVTGEIGNTMTWQDFDGWGDRNKLSDNLLQASVGITYTIGKAGWNRVADPRPYMVQADLLSDRLYNSEEENARLKKMLSKDKDIMEQMRSILEIEGLLEKYCFELSDSGEIRRSPRNNYSGLNALRARMRNKQMKAPCSQGEFMPAYWNPNDTTMITPEDYMLNVQDGKLFVGAPIFFFFKLGTTKITEKAQIVNIREIASAMKKYGLRARIIGAADAQTGTPEINDRLGIDRAKTISMLLTTLGVSEDDITTEGRGGIDDYKPLTANRNACVMLYYKNSK